MESLLKNRIYLYVFTIIITLSFTNCKPKTNEQVDKEVTCDTKKCSKSTSLNPNGDSELALLMREMYDSSASLKELIKKGKSPANFPEKFVKMQTAKPTDVKVKNVTFDALSNEYLKSLISVHQSPKKELVVNYNLMVQKCINCHQVFCPGPIQKIGKLKM